MRAFLLLIPAVMSLPAAAQTNPAPQSIPCSQSWGTTGFTSLPAGFAAWQGVSGSATTTQTLAESSAPTGDASAVGTSEPASAGQGGWYGYAPAGDGRLGILSSSNSTAGAVQLALALNTVGKSNITLAYDMINVVNSTRTVGAVCQYRVGDGGAWTTIPGGTGNPYVQSGGTKGAVTHASLTLPVEAENHPTVQIRWAVWRGTESGSSSGFAVDNITVSASTSPGPAHAPTAAAGMDQTLNISGGSVTCVFFDAVAGDSDGLTGVNYAWTPASGTGIGGWSQRTGSVTEVSSPGAAAVTLTAVGTYTFTLTVTDPTALTAGDTVTVTVLNNPPAGQYDPPTGYYDAAQSGGAWLTGTTLKNALHAIISANVTARSYEAAETALQLLDQDPNNANNIILIYNGASVPKAWNSSVWNREHQWPQSLLGSAPIGELFNLRPCNPNMNNSRGNKPFGTGSGEWDPGDHGANDRGTCARAMFFMATRYAQLDLIAGSSPSDGEMGDLNELLPWHYQNAVTTFEKRRNHLIWSSSDNPAYYQGNRNPYIDHPEFVWSIFGGGNNNSKLYLDATAPGNGSSSSNVSFRVIRGAALPVQTLTLNKVGANPTTYDVLVSGEAATPAAGVGQTFAADPQSRPISASILSTATAGIKTGAIIVDNTELSSGGAGMGSADGNDVINISAVVLEHANASFTTPADTNTLLLDFGNLQIGDGPVSREFIVYDLAAGATADLDIDAVSGSGATSVFASGVNAPTTILAGGNRVFIATINTAAVGSYSADYVLAVSDENVAGAAFGPNLTLTLTGSVVTVKPDFDANGHVDGTDLSFLWGCLQGADRGPVGINCQQADLDLDGDVDLGDYGRLQRCYSGPNARPSLACDEEADRP